MHDFLTIAPTTSFSDNFGLINSPKLRFEVGVPIDTKRESVGLGVNEKILLLIKFAQFFNYCPHY